MCAKLIAMHSPSCIPAYIALEAPRNWGHTKSPSQSLLSRNIVAGLGSGGQSMQALAAAMRQFEATPACSSHRSITFELVGSYIGLWIYRGCIKVLLGDNGKKIKITHLLPFFLGAWLASRARILPPIGMAAPLRDAFADSQPNFAFTATLRILRIA